MDMNELRENALIIKSSYRVINASILQRSSKVNRKISLAQSLSDLSA
jgi:hypothetical protein